MGTILVRRPARLAPPEVPTDEIRVAEAPKLPPPPPAVTSAGMMIMPVVGGAGLLMVAVVSPDRPLFAVAGVLFLIAIVSFGALMIVGQRLAPRRQLREARERYLDYIEDLRRRLRTTVQRQKAAAAWRYPAPDQLLDLARTGTRRWERRTADEDFLVVRLGTGDQPIATTITAATVTNPLDELDPVCLEASRQLRERYAVLPGQPVCVDLRKVSVLSVVGDRYAGRQLAQAVAAQLVTLHSPDEVRLAVVRAATSADDWEWVKWLPHVQAVATADGELPARLVAPTVAALFALLEPEWEQRLDAHQRRRGQPATNQSHLVVVIDGADLATVRGFDSPDRSAALADLGIHVIVLLGSRREEPEEVDDRVRITGRDAASGAWSAMLERSGWSLRADTVPAGALTALGRQFAPLRLLVEDPSDALASVVGLPDILGVADVATLDHEREWRPRPMRDFLRVPIGVGPARRTVILDLKESAHGGMGPHGLIVGATGSGKSEMLRTLISSLAIGHPPDRLALMLVDFKGGATFAGMAPLPHVAGIVTNIEDDLTLVDRMRDALYGEMQRRQEILKAAGNLPNVQSYQALRDGGEPLEPLPHLLVVIDEFSELLTAKPDFAELFVTIGRIGRSIGTHLLLATQRLETGRIRGLESHLSYRIGLRTFSDAESRDVIGTPDAYHLPPEPGSGYLKVDTTIYERFKAALVSAAYRPPERATRTVVPVVPYLSLNGVGAWLSRQVPAAPADEVATMAGVGERTNLDIIVERLSHGGIPRARPVWLEPLPPAIALDKVQDPLRRAAAGTCHAVLGLVDDPGRQRQFPLAWDFTGAAGNVVVAGAPQAGKSTLLRTMICSLAVAYAPGDVVFYCVDLGGGGLVPLAALPHVAAVATRLDAERIRRTVHDVMGLLAAREELCRQYGLDSAAALRTARAAGKLPPGVAGDVFLVVDGWASFREDYEPLEALVSEIAARGGNFGVHVVVSLTQSMQLRLRTQPSFGGRIELRLNDPFDSQFGRKTMAQVSKDTPGRGVVEGELLCHVALPRIDGGTGVNDLRAAQQQLIEVVAERWPEGVVPRVRVLPTHYDYDELPPVDPAGRGVPVGISERDLEPAGVDLEGGDPHLRVYGDGETGKTNLLRLLLRGHMALRPPERLGIVVVDYRRTLPDVVPPEYLLAYCTAQQQTRTVAAEVADSLAKRLPGPDVTTEQLRTRSWWNGVDVLFVVDDYDLVATPSGNPLQPLVDYLPQARDVGLHLVVARRTGGLSRAMHEPLLQRLGDIASPGFLLSGDRMEGHLVNGVAATRLPPGRALYVARGGRSEQVQIAWLPPDRPQDE